MRDLFRAIGDARNSRRVDNHLSHDATAAEIGERIGAVTDQTLESLAAEAAEAHQHHREAAVRLRAYETPRPDPGMEDGAVRLGFDHPWDLLRLASSGRRARFVRQMQDAGTAISSGLAMSYYGDVANAVRGHEAGLYEQFPGSEPHDEDK